MKSHESREKGAVESIVVPSWAKSTVSGCVRKDAKESRWNIPGRRAHMVRIAWREPVACSWVEGKRRRQRPLLRVSATKLRASASWEAARKLDILTVTKREAEPPIPIALTVSVGDGAVRSEALRASVDDLNNGTESCESFKLRD